MQRVLIETPIRPGEKSVDAAKYQAMRDAILASLPDKEPGLNREEVVAEVTRRVPQELFPRGSGVTWWSKAVQLDLEAKGVIVRHGQPLRWRRA